MASPSLPPEILLEIIRKVDQVDPKPASQITRSSTLAALSRVCKDFHAFTEPYLFSRFDQISEHGQELPLLLRTLLEKPYLGHFIKTYVGTCFTATTIEMAPFKDLFTQLRCAAVWSFAKGLKKKAELKGGAVTFSLSSWSYQMMHGVWDAITALLLCLLPNLEEFILSEYASVYGYRAIDAIFDRAGWLQDRNLPIDIEASGYQNIYAYEDENPKFQKATRLWKSAPKRGNMEFGMANLRVVRISCNHLEAYPAVGLPMRHATSFLGLKSVEKFSGHMILDDDEDEDFSAHDFKTTDLTIHHTAIFMGVSEPFLASFKHLKRLVCNMDYNVAVAEEQSQYYEFAPPHVSHAIAHLSESLEELSLTQEKYRDVIETGSDQYLPLESLASFGKLRKLEVSADILLGRRPISPVGARSSDDVVIPYKYQRSKHLLSMFPDSLEYLSITHCDSAIFAVIMPFLSSRIGEPGKLVEINLEFRPHLPVGPSVREWSICQELALKCGIRINKSPDNTIRSCPSCDYSRELAHCHETRRKGILQE